MKRGVDQIIACPRCRALAWYMTLMSGNTMGARIWTDAKQIAPMMPVPPAVVRCSGCTECYWLAGATKVGTAYLWVRGERKIDPAWLAAPEVSEPSESEYYGSLAAGLAVDATQERNLRILAWQRANDAFRDSPGPPRDDGAISESRRANLEALTLLLADDNVNDRLMRAEIRRELGQFDAARDVLVTIEDPRVRATVELIRSLCDRGDTLVRELR